jgi:hypothetical protein
MPSAGKVRLASRTLTWPVTLASPTDGQPQFDPESDEFLTAHPAGEITITRVDF